MPCRALPYPALSCLFMLVSDDGDGDGGDGDGGDGGDGGCKDDGDGDTDGDMTNGGIAVP